MFENILFYMNNCKMLIKVEKATTMCMDVVHWYIVMVNKCDLPPKKVHIPHSQGQNKNNTVDQLIEADSTQPDESSANTSSLSDSSQSSSNVSLPLIQNSHISNYSNRSESESLNSK